MTFKERLAKERSFCISELYFGGCVGCPCHYGYEEKLPDFCEFAKANDETCTKCWNRTILGTEDKEMKVSDLKVGDICKLRNGDICIVLSNSFSDNGLGLYDNSTCIGYLSNYNDDLTYSDRERDYRDIVAIYKASEPNMMKAYGLTMTVLKGTCNMITIDWTWQGNKEIVKEMTVADVEKLVGCRVKIVKEQD